VKQLEVIDEWGVPWFFHEQDHLFPVLAAAKIKLDEYACFRDHLFIDLVPEALPEARERLCRITEQCLNQEEPHDELLKQLLHAARSFTLLDEIANLEDDPQPAEDSDARSDR
jgi:hypothetical protein